MFSPPPPEVHLEKFHEPGIFNYSVLLLSEDKTTLYVGAREAVFALSAHNVSEKQHEVGRGRRPAQHFLPDSALGLSWGVRPFPGHAAPLPSSPQGARPHEATSSPCLPAASVLPGPATHPGASVLPSWTFYLFFMENLQPTQEWRRWA